MPGLSFYDKQHIQKIAAQQAVIANIFNQFILSGFPRISINGLMRGKITYGYVIRE